MPQIDSSSDYSIINQTHQIPNPVLYQQWLQGIQTDEVTGFTSQIYVKHQYQQFYQMEQFLRYPTINAQFMPITSQQVIDKMLQMYYEFDHVVLREFMGRKRRHGSKHLNRKDLLEISQKTAISLGSVSRQLENVRQISKNVENQALLTTISNQYLLGSVQSRRYAILLFALDNQLDACCRHQKLLPFTYADLEFVFEQIFEHWTCSSPVNASEQFDQQLVMTLRDCRQVLLGGGKDIIEEFRTLIVLQCPSISITTPSLKLICRNMLQLATSITQPKDTKQLILALVEKIVEPSAAIGWRFQELQDVLMAMEQQWSKLSVSLVDTSQSIMSANAAGLIDSIFGGAGGSVAGGSKNGSQGSLQLQSSLDAQFFTKTSTAWTRMCAVIRISVKKLYVDN